MRGDALDGLPCGLVTIDADMTVREANVMFCALIDRSADEVIGVSIDALFTAPARIFLHTNVVPSVQLSRSVSEVYLSLRSAGGEAVPVLMNAVAGSSARGPVIRCAFVKMGQRDRWELETRKARRAAEAERDRHRETATRLSEALSGLQASVDEVTRTHWLLGRVAEVLPICMGCAKVRPGQGDWESVADFLRSNSSFLSHGYCPTCAAVAAAEWGIDLVAPTGAPPDTVESRITPVSGDETPGSVRCS